MKSEIDVALEPLRSLLSEYEALYDSFDGGHRRDHMEGVRRRALELASKYLPEQADLVYIASTLHDIGLSVNREDHEKEGADLVTKDRRLEKILGREKLLQVVEAVREHRASTGNPQTVLGKIISDADRGANSLADALMRPIEHGKKHFPELNDEGQLKRAAEQIVQKFSPGGYGRRHYFPETDKRLSELYDPLIKLIESGDFEKLEEIIRSISK